MFPFGAGNYSERAGERRYSRDELRRMLDWLAAQALGGAGPGDAPPEQPPTDAQPAPPPRIFARITGRWPTADTTALYSWEYAAPADGAFNRDPAGWASAADPNDTPAWELTGNFRVPTDGSAVVELIPSAGGNYYHFFYPERYTPARITKIEGAASAGSSSGSAPAAGGVQYGWEELSPASGGNWTTTINGRTGWPGRNPLYSVNGRPAAVGDVVFIERGFALAPDVVTAIEVHGDGTTAHPRHTLELVNATAGTWTLTLFDENGNSITVGPFDADPLPSAALVQAAITANAGWELTSVSVAFGVYNVAMGNTFADVPVISGDPFALIGLQEWVCEPTGSPVCTDFQQVTETKDQCDYPDMMRYRRVVSYLCGARLFPEPAWARIGKVGCCECPTGSGSTGSPGSGGSYPPRCCPDTPLCIVWPPAPGLDPQMTRGITLSPVPTSSGPDVWTWTGTLNGIAATITADWLGCVFNSIGPGGVTYGTLNVYVSAADGSCTWQDYTGTAPVNLASCWNQSTPVECDPVGPYDAACLGTGSPPPPACYVSGGSSPCNPGSSGSGSELYWCVQPASGGSAPTGSLSGSGSVGSGTGNPVCVAQSAMTGGTPGIGNTVTWSGGTGTVVSGPWTAPDCGGACDATGSGGSGTQPGTCCFPLPDTLHLTGLDAFGPIGVVPITTTRPGSGSGPWEVRGLATPCGPLLVQVSCDPATGLFEVFGEIADDSLNTCLVFRATAAPSSCDTLLVKFHGAPSGDSAGILTNQCPGESFACFGAYRWLLTP